MEPLLGELQPVHIAPAIDADRAPSEAGGHVVQFYEDERFLAAAVADFLAAGLSAGEPLLVIATEPHRQAFSARLDSKGLSSSDALRSGQLTMLDARQTLSVIMSGAMPDVTRFQGTLSGLLDTIRPHRVHAPVRVYGEMVDLLWGDGNTDGAIRLEELWNELASSYTFNLLCAYAMGRFYKESHAPQLREICRHHTRVIPTERYMQSDGDARLVETALLQQRARALESEIAHREDLEGRLRETLAERRRDAEERERLLERERAARADAEAANRTKSEFLAVMSHELRTPLNAIGGHVQLIEMGVHGPVTDAQRDALMRVQRSQRHLLSLINDVLNLVRVETGRVEYTVEDVPVASLVADVTSMVQSMLSAKRLTCELAMPVADDEPPLAVRADRERTHQILLNLLTNAIKFTPTDGHITIDALADSEADTVRLRVCDTGIGIPAAKLEAIFEPFVQLARSSISRQDGVGLGLAISRDLARGMGGDLQATSTPGQGAIFTLTLPRARGSVAL